jgi:hypothetical protein
VRGLVVVDQDLRDVARAPVVDRLERAQDARVAARVEHDSESTRAAGERQRARRRVGRPRAEERREPPQRPVVGSDLLQLDREVAGLGVRERDDQGLDQDLRVRNVEILDEPPELVEEPRRADGEDAVRARILGERELARALHRPPAGRVEGGGRGECVMGRSRRARGLPVGRRRQRLPLEQVLEEREELVHVAVADRVGAQRDPRVGGLVLEAREQALHLLVLGRRGRDHERPGEVILDCAVPLHSFVLVSSQRLWHYLLY